MIGRLVKRKLSTHWRNWTAQWPYCGNSRPGDKNLDMSLKQTWRNSERLKQEMEMKGTVGAKRIHTAAIFPENAGTFKQRPTERGSYEMDLIPRQESKVPGV